MASFRNVKNFLFLSRLLYPLTHDFKIASSVPLEIYARGLEAVKAYDKALTGGKAYIKRIPEYQTA